MMLVNPSLAERQQHLLNAIFGLGSSALADAVFAQNGLRIYQNNLLMTAAKTLSISYPVLLQMIGEEAMIAAARELIKQTPPYSGDWADWGGSLADFLAENQLGKESPFLIDMAKFEWQLHLASRAKVNVVSAERLQQLAQLKNKTTLTLKPSLHTRVISSHYPLAALWFAHQAPNHSGYMDASQLSRAIAVHEGESYLMVYQDGLAPVFRQIKEEEFLWFQAINAGTPLAELLQEYPDINFPAWFAEAVSHNWIEL